MDDFKQYVSYVLIQEKEAFIPKMIHVSSEKLDDYLTENKLLIAPKLKDKDKLIEWLEPKNREIAIKEAMSYIDETDFQSMIHKSTELIRKRNEFIKKHSKVVDLDLVR